MLIRWLQAEIGQIRLKPHRTADHEGWLLCDGRAVSRTIYAGLFSAISTTFGVGDGSTTFNIPDSQGRAIIGIGTGSGLTARANGDKIGVETHILTTAQMPSHRHNTTQSADVLAGGAAARGTTIGGGGYTSFTEYTGSDNAHPNIQPSIAIPNFIYAGV